MAMPMAAVAAAMPSCCVKSAVAGVAAGQWVERSGGRVARGGFRSSMWQMGGCYWPSEQLRCAWRAPPGRLAVVSCTTSSTTTSTTTTDVDVPTVAATKEAFLKALLKPIPSSYETTIQELLVQQHSMRYNATYTYDPIFALGVVTVFNQLMEGYPSDMESQSIFEAYISALNEDPDLYRMDAERLEKWAASVSGSEIAEFARREAGVEGIFKIIGARAAGTGKINYSRFFAIGLFRLLERANATDSAVLEQVKGYRENSSWSSFQQEQESLMDLKMEERTLQSPKADPECGSVSTTGRNEDNLLEVSDALETVAKALQDVARKKALAEEAAAVWKRKYEMERGRNDRLERLTAGHAALDSMRPEEPSPSHDPETHADELRASGVLTGKLPIPRNSPWPKVEGMINQQMPPHSAVSFSELDLDTVESLFPADKASFKLTWGRTSKKSKTDVVSFKSGDITMAIGTNKQITLVWDSPPRSMVILKKPNSSTVHELSKRMIRWLNEETNSIVYVEPRVKGELVQEDPYFEFLQKCETEDEVMNLHKKVDLVITLGGDGTVLWAASMFKGPMPPLVSFSMGSLGFMTQFESDLYKESLMKVIRGPVYITLRHRLHCQIVRNAENLKDGNYSSEPEEHLVLNEVSIDRGMASALSNLQCYCDGHFVTTVQGDGLILSTPSGSTAYSLAAGGSMLHPQVPGILFTPICPHSLSFRPVILPEYVTIRIQLPLKSRGQAWASFDGKARQRLSGGDALIVCMSAWPVPTVCDEESSGDFLRSVREGLHWNLRVCQLSDGPQQIS